MATKEEINAKIKERETRWLKGANYRPLSEAQIAQNRIWLQKYKPDFLRKPHEQVFKDEIIQEAPQNKIEEDMQEVFDKF